MQGNPFLEWAEKILDSLEMFFRRYPLKIWQIILPLIILLAVFLYIFIATPPKNFPLQTILTVEEGTGLYTLSQQLEKENMIRSSFWFRWGVISQGGERQLKSGDYALNKPENVFILARRIVKAEHQIPTVRLTIPEGFTVKDISDLFDSRFKKFDHTIFLARAQEGYLFPDTYFVEESITATSTITLLESNFYKKIEPLKDEIESSKHTLAEIIIMASILESEAREPADKQIVSNILWKRIKLGMALQVDATLTYLTGKTSEELTADDLVLESAFNTYVHTGLPPHPISNPGIISIQAAIRPTTTPYLYFLTDDNGMMHYAKTFDEHKRNKEKYLR